MEASEDRKRIYFAGAIRGGRDDATLYLEIARQLRGYGEVLTEHVEHSELTARGEPTEDILIHDRDIAWLTESEFLVAEVTIPSLGVGYEIGKATEWGKKVLCLYRPRDGHSLSAMIAGSSNVELRLYENVGELKEVFDEFFG